MEELKNTNNNQYAGEPQYDLPGVFDACPVPLWLEDLSDIYLQLKQWQSEGMADVHSWLFHDYERLQKCASLLQILRVNPQTLKLFAADSLTDIKAYAGNVLPRETLDGFACGIEKLWHGQHTFDTHVTNYTLAGTRLDITLKVVLLPDVERHWDRVLMAMEDVTELKYLQREARRQADDAREIFNQAPVCLMVEDFSGIKMIFDELAQRGVDNLQQAFLDDPNLAERCMHAIRVVNFNQYTLQLFNASTRAELLSRLRASVLHEEMKPEFTNQLIGLWNGKLNYQGEVLKRSLQGEPLHIRLQQSVYRGHEQDWSRVLVSMTDITEQKQTEAHLKYVSEHDALTGLYNRTCVQNVLQQFNQKQTPLISFIALDLNDFKSINDKYGHAAGDELLMEMGRILTDNTCPPAYATRSGGDEFLIMLPDMDDAAAQRLLNTIHASIATANKHRTTERWLTVSAGIATSQPDTPIDDTLIEVDRAMYADKRRFYKHHDRRAGTQQSTHARPSQPACD